MHLGHTVPRSFSSILLNSVLSTVINFGPTPPSQDDATNTWWDSNGGNFTLQLRPSTGGDDSGSGSGSDGPATSEKKAPKQAGPDTHVGQSLDGVRSRNPLDLIKVGAGGEGGGREGRGKSGERKRGSARERMGAGGRGGGERQASRGEKYWIDL